MAESELEKAFARRRSAPPVQTPAKNEPPAKNELPETLQKAIGNLGDPMAPSAAPSLPDVSDGGGASFDSPELLSAPSGLTKIEMGATPPPVPCGLEPPALPATTKSTRRGGMVLRTNNPVVVWCQQICLKIARLCRAAVVYD